MARRRKTGPGFAGYDAQGNYVPDSVTIDNDTGAVEATLTPGIVREKIPEGQSASPMPSWADASDGVYWYGPTDAAIAEGKLIAAAQTLAEVPERVVDLFTNAANAVKTAVPQIGVWVVIGLVAYAVIKGSEALE